MATSIDKATKDVSKDFDKAASGVTRDVDVAVRGVSKDLVNTVASPLVSSTANVTNSHCTGYNTIYYTGRTKWLSESYFT